MRQAVRAIIIKDKQLLVMHRNKFGEEYETLPGGNVEIGESPEQAIYRSIAEETTVRFNNPRLVFIEHAGDPYGDQSIFLCDYQDGDPVLHPGSEEFAINKLGKNLYDPRWIQLDRLPELPFVSEKLKTAILHGCDKGWSESVVEIY